MRLLLTILVSAFLVWTIFFLSEKKTWNYDITMRFKIADTCSVTDRMTITTFIDTAAPHFVFYGNVLERKHERCQVRIGIEYDDRGETHETILVVDDRSVYGDGMEKHWDISYALPKEFSLNPLEPSSLFFNVDGTGGDEALNSSVTVVLRTHWGKWFVSQHNAPAHSQANTDQWVTWYSEKDQAKSGFRGEAVVEYYYLHTLRQPAIIIASAMLGGLLSLLLNELSGAVGRIAPFRWRASKLAETDKKDQGSIVTEHLSSDESQELHERPSDSTSTLIGPASPVDTDSVQATGAEGTDMSTSQASLAANNDTTGKAILRQSVDKTDSRS